jgi:2,4-dienoyl-CoA reductase (NADPH2)
MHLAYCPDGEITARILEFYRLRARGGVGLIVVGAVGIDPKRINRHGMIQMHDDRFIPGLRKLTDAIHNEGARIFPQLWHGGRYQRSKEYDGQQAVAPSPVFSRFTGETPRELSAFEIEEIISFFAAAAGRAKAAGFDGAELAGSAGYLIAQFLSPVTNQRTDRYGGSLEDRMTFAKEVVAAVKEAAGKDFPLMMRVAGNDFMSGGNTNAEAREFCLAMEKAGVDALSITGGWHETHVPQITMQVPAGVFAYLGRAIKESVSIPVVLCNRIDIKTAEENIDLDHADFIGIARGFVADPELAAKGACGATHLIRPCVGCNQGCMDNIFFGKHLSCLCNAEAGREFELLDAAAQKQKAQSEKPEKILVIGAGVAGMEFARVAASKGHNVTIWEEKEHPGGQLRLAGIPPGRNDFLRLNAYLVHACKTLGVSIKFKQKATEDRIMSVMKTDGFDYLVMATGALPATHPMDAESSVKIVQAWDVLLGRVKAGKRVVVAGGGAVGVETALMLAEIGTLDAESLRFLMLHNAEPLDKLMELLTRGSKQITIVEMTKQIGGDIGPSTRWSMIAALKKLGVTLKNLTKVTGIDKDGIAVEGPDGNCFLEADTMVLAMGSTPDNGLFKALEMKVEKILLIGDARKPGNIQAAIRDAYDKAASV